MNKINAVMFLISHSLDPRISKRLKVFENKNIPVEIISWDRSSWTYGVKETGYKINSIGKPFNQKSIVQRAIHFLLFFLKSFKLLIKKKPKQLYVGNIDMLLIAYVYKMIYSNTKIFYEVSDLSFRMVPRYQKLLKKAEFFFLGKVNKLIITSSGYWDIYFKDIFREKDTLLIENCPPQNIFNKYDKRKRCNDFVIGWVGSVRFYDEIKLLFDATRDMQGIKVIIAGDGPKLKSVKKLAEEYPNVQVTGAYDYNNIAQIYSSIDCVYMINSPNSMGGKVAMANRLYESIACSLPIIVSKGTLMEKFVLEKGIGLSVNHKSREELYHALKEVKENKMLLSEIELNATKIKSYYTAENMENILFNGLFIK